jgi:hypothetical protein
MCQREEDFRLDEQWQAVTSEERRLPQFVNASSNFIVSRMA